MTSSSPQGYLHGFDPQEQQRLIDQARVLSKFLYDDLPFSTAAHILEIGCGVGAQTKLLLKKFPQLKITGIDTSSAQLEKAREYLGTEIASGRVQLVQGDARSLPFSANEFDGAYICWVLEHLSLPVGVLKEALRCLRAGAPVVCTEVMNFSLYTSPTCKNLMNYWNLLNQRQLQLGGDPFVGAKLGAMLLDAGFKEIQTASLVRHFDKRNDTERSEFLAYWKALLQSAAPELLQAQLTTEGEVQQVMFELDELAANSETVFYYSPMRGVGRKPA